MKYKNEARKRFSAVGIIVNTHDRLVAVLCAVCMIQERKIAEFHIIGKITAAVAISWLNWTSSMGPGPNGLTANSHERKKIENQSRNPKKATRKRKLRERPKAGQPRKIYIPRNFPLLTTFSAESFVRKTTVVLHGFCSITCSIWLMISNDFEKLHTITCSIWWLAVTVGVRCWCVG